MGFEEWEGHNINNIQRKNLEKLEPKHWHEHA
jgi:hypothetical protein